MLDDLKLVGVKGSTLYLKCRRRTCCLKASSVEGSIVAVLSSVSTSLSFFSREYAEAFMELCNSGTKAGFTLRTQIYAAYADHLAHLGRVFSTTNADLCRRDRAGAECKHSYNTPSFRRGCWIVIG